MPEYYDPNVRPVQARPFTFQELLVIPSMYKESYEKSMKEYNDYADKAALIRSMAGESPTAQKAFAEYDNGVKGLSEAMLSGRWNPQMASEAQNLREMYRNKIIPIGTAINNYQEDLKRFDALNKDGKAFGNTATLENYIQDPNYRGRFYSGSALQQEAMTAGALAANGITPELLTEYRAKPNDPKFANLNNVIGKILKENGWDNLDDEKTKELMKNYVLTGFDLGMQASANKTYDENLKQQRALQQIAYKHRLDNSNSGGGNGLTQKGRFPTKNDLSNLFNLNGTHFRKNQGSYEKFDWSKSGIDFNVKDFDEFYEKNKNNNFLINALSLVGLPNSEKDNKRKESFKKLYDSRFSILSNVYNQKEYYYDLPSELQKKTLYDYILGNTMSSDGYYADKDGYIYAKTKFDTDIIDRKDFADKTVRIVFNPLVKGDVKIVIPNYDGEGKQKVFHVEPGVLGFDDRTINNLYEATEKQAIISGMLNDGVEWNDKMTDYYMNWKNMMIDFDQHVMTSPFFTITDDLNQNTESKRKING